MRVVNNDFFSPVVHSSELLRGKEITGTTKSPFSPREAPYFGIRTSVFWSFCVAFPIEWLFPKTELVYSFFLMQRDHFA